MKQSDKQFIGYEYLSFVALACTSISVQNKVNADRVVTNVCLKTQGVRERAGALVVLTDVRRILTEVDLLLEQLEPVSLTPHPPLTDS